MFMEAVTQLFASCSWRTEGIKFPDSQLELYRNLIGSRIVITEKSCRDRDYRKKATGTAGKITAESRPGPEIWQIHRNYDRDCSKKELPGSDRDRDQKTLVPHISNTVVYDAVYDRLWPYTESVTVDMGLYRLQFLFTFFVRDISALKSADWIRT